ncbi:hypothetical protein [Nocardioides sp. YIM 152315]|uniref:hypothetical protein n=1 Tax=Nocardioides sp. YIM 152315 TaxID=3031760 RepID=UPI0023DA23F9|nr:hypothetical protein [Nocardioides sp. YIM 152315]MDF1605628.1 hypothetical protein [Nocardioides sp. YIM 152315]
MRRLLVLLLAVVLLGGCGDDADDYCDAVADRQEELSEVVGAGQPDALLQSLDILRELQDRAPSDISDEWQQVVGSIEGLRDALDDAGVDAAAYDPQHPPAGLAAAQRKAIADAATRLGSAETAQALQDLDQQARDVCHTPLTL